MKTPFRRLAPRLLPVSALLLSLALGHSAHAQPVAASVAAKNKTELTFRVKEDNPQQIWRRKLVSGIGFNLSASAWKLMLSREGVDSIGRLSSNLAEYAREHGIGDLDRTESAGTSRAANQPKVDALLKKVKSRVGVSVEATQSAISPAEGQLLLRYVDFVGQFLAGENLTPKGNRVVIKLVFSPTAEDVSVSSAAGDSVLTIVAPTSEPDDWNGKMGNGLKRFGKE